VKRIYPYVCFVLALAASVSAEVSVTSPVAGTSVGSPVNFVAAASTTSCSRGVASMGVYVNDQLTYVVNGASLNAKLPLGPGSYKTTVEEWDYCGGATFTIVPISVTGQSGVFVTSPANNSTSSPTVHFVATATSTCPQGVASMGIYTAPSPGSLAYVVQGASLDTTLRLSSGTYNTVVEEWDRCGGAAFTPVKITIADATPSYNASGKTTLYNVQASQGWRGWGELAPAYEICSSCSPWVTWAMAQSGGSTKFDIGGTVPYSDVLWSNPVIGQGSSQGLPDSSHTLLPAVKNFVYDAYFFSGNLPASQVLEFDVSQYFQGLSLIWGNQCRIAGGHEWDIWNNLSNKWVATGIPCNPTNNAWNHVTIQMARTSDNQLLYQSITLNGVTTQLNRYDRPNSAPSGWWGITLNFQMDGNYKQSPYTVYLDKLNFTYW